MRSRSSLLSLIATFGLALALAAASGCAEGSNNPDGGSGMDSGPRPDTGTPMNVACGPSAAPCCAGGVCELGLRCGRGDVCCIGAGGPTTGRCEGSDECCAGLRCESGICCTPEHAACTGSGECCDGTVCHEGVCTDRSDPSVPTDRGGLGQPCLDGFTCASSAASRLVCVEGTCVACGDSGGACCDGSNPCSSASLGCEVMMVGGTATAMCVSIDDSTGGGDIDEPCAPGADGAGECSGSLVCVGGTCLEPDDRGFEGAPCYPRNRCDVGLICNTGSGLCEAPPDADGDGVPDCGRDGSMCCDTGGSEGSCTGSLGCEFGECTTCQGPSLSCVLGGILPGQECCAGSTCRPAPVLPRCCMGEGGGCENSLDCCGFMYCEDGACACGSENSLCIDSSECCDGLTCQGFLCKPDTAMMCVEIGSTCSASGECCDGAACSATRSEPTAPPADQCCSVADTACASDAECCGRMRCRSGTCECVEGMGFCERDVDCCGGTICIAGSCVDDEGGSCRREMDTCGSSAECCGLGLGCEAIMRDGPRVCCVSTDGSRCRTDNECCGGMRCEDDACQPIGYNEPCYAPNVCNDDEGLSCDLAGSGVCCMSAFTTLECDPGSPTCCEGLSCAMDGRGEFHCVAM